MIFGLNMERKEAFTLSGAIILELIWNNRNQVLFEKKTSEIDSLVGNLCLLKKEHDWRSEIPHNNSVFKIHSKWSHPPKGHVKFNCNAAMGKEFSIVAVVARVWRGTMVLAASKEADIIIPL